MSSGSRVINYWVSQQGIAVLRECRDTVISQIELATKKRYQVYLREKSREIKEAWLKFMGDGSGSVEDVPEGAVSVDNTTHDQRNAILKDTTTFPPCKRQEGGHGRTKERLEELLELLPPVITDPSSLPPDPSPPEYYWWIVTSSEATQSGGVLYSHELNRDKRVRECQSALVNLINKYGSQDVASLWGIKGKLQTFSESLKRFGNRDKALVQAWLIEKDVPELDATTVTDSDSNNSDATTREPSTTAATAAGTAQSSMQDSTLSTA